MTESVLKFTGRFGDCDWLTGNCYYFAVILRDRFGGVICYDTSHGHFVTRIDDVYYDYSGVYNPDRPDAVVEWSRLKAHDPLQYGRVLRDCVENNTI